MDVMMRRRELMGMQKNSELYPIGTNLYTNVIFQIGTINTNTGEFDETGDAAISDYLPVSTSYEYTRSYRLYNVYNYDENHNYLGYQYGVNDLSQSVISAFIPGTMYIRTAVLSSYRNSTTGMIGAPNCWLKRTA